MDLLTELSSLQSFKSVVILPKANLKDGTPQDYVLRYFAFLERYKKFDHSVRDFLNDFTQSAVLDPHLEARPRHFKRTFEFLSQAFPTGVRSRKGVTPINLFEAVAVGAAPCLRPQSQSNTIDGS